MSIEYDKTKKTDSISLPIIACIRIIFISIRIYLRDSANDRTLLPMRSRKLALQQ